MCNLLCNVPYVVEAHHAAEKVASELVLGFSADEGLCGRDNVVYTME